MTDMEILQLADQCGVVAVTKHEWDGKRFNHTDECLDGDAAALVIFAKLVAQHEREACAEVCKKHADVYGAFEQTPELQSAWAACIDNCDAIRARGQA
jgi:hypothetical protein